MNLKEPNEPGVSEVVGEMLMIALVVVLLAVFSAALFNYLPVDREPTVTIMMTSDGAGDFTFWHKGGDWVKVEDLNVVIVNETYQKSFSRKSGNLVIVPDKMVFDLGSNVTVKMPGTKEGNETIKMVTPRTVVYSGRTGR
jgi:FlaG/FlaF family flagellin (archaellin)